MRLHYWGCGTYGHHTGKKWPTWVEVEGYETSHNSARRTSRLAFVVCGIQLNDICRSLGAPLNADLRELAGDKGKDTVTFLLVRYAKAHASAVRRGPEHRPLCPGPYVNTHSLWTWATRPKDINVVVFGPALGQDTDTFSERLRVIERRSKSMIN